MGYSIDEHGKAPDFALELASPNTARNDERGKRIDYANFGVREYWRFDASGGRWYQQPLAGDVLVGTGNTSRLRFTARTTTATGDTARF